MLYYLNLVLALAVSNIGNRCLAKWGECNSNTGPAGEFGCVNVNRYTGMQYANCLSAAYISQKSYGKHLCENRNAKYCWYQCALENHDQNDGVVTPDCACTQNDVIPQQLPLPENCYSPDGRDCNLYHDCLEKKHLCDGQQGDYAIEYAEKFCRLYSENYNSFSAKGQSWVEGVRKCLQVSLVPMIRPYYKGNCQDIQKKAFESYAPCYINPGFGVNSICDMSCADWLTAFWTIKSSIVTSDGFSTLAAMVEVGFKCTNKAFKCSVGSNTAVSTRFGRMLIFLLILRRDTSKQQEGQTNVAVDRNEMAAKVTDHVCNHLKWNKDQLDWFGFSLDNDTGKGENFSVNIWLINKNKDTAEDKAATELKRFTDWISSGKEQLDVEVSGVKVKPVTLSVCNDSTCEQINTTIKAAEPIPVCEPIIVYVHDHATGVSISIGLLSLVFISVFI